LNSSYCAFTKQQMASGHWQLVLDLHWIFIRDVPKISSVLELGRVSYTQQYSDKKETEAQWKKIGLQHCDCRVRDGCWETARASGLRM